MVEEIKKQEKERVIKSIKEWLKDNIYERGFREFYGYSDGYDGYYYDDYNLCVTRYYTEEEFWKAFDKFVKTL